MSSLKPGPFSIFLILLIVLVISVVFSKSHWSIPEGFISYNYAGESHSATLQQMIILPYSKIVKVYHVYDSIYYDVNNGSVIEFFGKQYNASKTDSENVLTDMFVLPRTGTNVKNYSLTSDVKTVDEAVCPNDTTSNMSNNSWVFPENANTKLNSFQYQVLYIPWGKDTVLFIYDITTSKKLVSSTLFSNNTSSEISNMNQDIFRISNLHYKTDSDSRNNTYIVEPLYDPAKSSPNFSDVFQISGNVLFDVKNGYLMIRNGGKMDIYNGSSVPLFSQVDTSGKVKDTPVSMSNLKSFVLNDVDGQNIVVYIPIDSKNIMVAVLTVDPNNSNLFMIRNAVRFNSSVPSGIDGKPNIEHKSSTATTATTTPCASSAKTESKMEFSNLSLNDVISKYYQQYYGSTNGGGGNVPGAYSNDFLLKTQIIPPVCPSCPSCPNNVSCTNCGGNGGAGMVGSIKNNTTYYDVFGNKIVYDASKNPILVDKNGNQIIQIFDNSGNQVQFVYGHFIPIPPTSSGHIASSSPTTSPNTNFGGTVSSLGSSASNLGGNVVNTTGSIVGGAVGAAAGLAGTTIGTAAGLAGTTIGTAGSIVNNAISTVGKLGQGTTGTGMGMGTMGTGGTSNDSKIYQNSRGLAGNYNGDAGQSSVAPKGNYITKGVDSSNYYGAVPDKGSSNFIPLTSDFSKFGR